MDKTRYDIHEPSIGHFNRFQDRLKEQHQSKKINWYKFIAVAAILLLFFSIGLNSMYTDKGSDLADISPKMEETQDYFNTVIHKELEQISKIKNSKNSQIIEDAFVQLNTLEKDYSKQKLALATNSENKMIIYAMITNYQKRINVLSNLLNELNEFNNINSKYNENNNI